ncbi:MAG: ATP-binding protein, partial [Candidatus Binatia bacterium]
GQRLAAIPPLVQEVRRKGRVVSLDDVPPGAWSAESAEDSHRELTRLNAQLLVPVMFKGDLIGLIVVGNKESGVFFSADDRDFLATLANQGALSLANALSYQEVQELNASLEQKVAGRTQELAYTNTELHHSLQRLEQAYRDLQHSQEHLLQAEKMAALGRLTAGIAHEMNTPLGASLTSLKLLRELVEEYRVSISDPGVEERDHREIAAEMDKLVRVTQQWMEKTAAHIRSLKLHTRDLQPGEDSTFSLMQVIEDTRLLLAHRLRLSQCTLHVSCPVPEPLLRGDASKLGQVLTNLVVNAIDAYKDTGQDDGEIQLVVAAEKDGVEIRVRDYGCGIPAEHIESIFDEFFSTKPLGEGTGLGLPIARDIVTKFFRGTISAESVLGQGSVFLLRLPRGDIQEEQSVTATGLPTGRKSPRELRVVTKGK